jgi:hypothetical protein
LLAWSARLALGSGCVGSLGNDLTFWAVRTIQAPEFIHLPRWALGSVIKKRRKKMRKHKKRKLLRRARHKRKR